MLQTDAPLPLLRHRVQTLHGCDQRQAQSLCHLPIGADRHSQLKQTNPGLLLLRHQDRLVLLEITKVLLRRNRLALCRLNRRCRHRRCRRRNIQRRSILRRRFGTPLKMAEVLEAREHHRIEGMLSRHILRTVLMNLKQLEMLLLRNQTRQRRLRCLMCRHPSMVSAHMTLI